MLEKNKKIACIDFGSNTALLCIGEFSGQKLNILYDEGKIVRLSEQLQEGKTLNPQAKIRAYELLQSYSEIIKSYDIDDIRAVGTAVFRKASDGKEFAQEIKKQFSIPLQIISGETEAELSFLSIEKAFAHLKNLALIDIGGASTEIRTQNQKVSLKIGSVALFENPTRNLATLIRKEISDHLKKEEIPFKWVAVAATATTLAAIDLTCEPYDPQKIHGHKLNFDTVKRISENLFSLNLEERKKIPGLDPKRADVLPIASLILIELMNFFEIPQITVSDWGLRHALFFRWPL